MITVTSESSHEKLNVLDEEIILNGPPSDLQGHIRFENNEDDRLRIKTLALVDKNKKRISDKGRSSLKLSLRIHPGEQKMKSIRHTLPANTPPGTYESYLMLGDSLKKIKMVVQPTIEIDLHPTDFTLQDTSPGKKHEVILTLTNTGNLPFQIPDLKHASSMDMDLFCRAFGFGFRKNEAEGFMESMDVVAENIKENLAEWADVSIDEYGKIVEPEECVTLTLHLQNPRNADPKRDYAIDLRFWDKELSFFIKSHIEKNNQERHEKQK